MALRLARGQERPARLLEAAVLDLLALGRVRPPAERLARVMALGTEDLRCCFEQLLAAGAAAALAGALPRGAADAARAQLAPLLRV